MCLNDRVEFNWLDDIVHKFMDYDQSDLLRVSYALLNLSRNASRSTVALLSLTSF